MALHTDVQAGPIINQSPSAIHRAVHLTAMHSNFDQNTLNEWVQRDAVRQEEGQPDSLSYLTDALRLLMTVTARQQQFAAVCRQQQETVDHALRTLESTFSTLKELRIDTTDLEAQTKVLRFQSKQLQGTAAIYDDFAEQVQVMELFNQLQDRIDAVMRPCGQVAGGRRCN